MNLQYINHGKAAAPLPGVIGRRGFLKTAGVAAAGAAVPVGRALPYSCCFAAEFLALFW